MRYTLRCVAHGKVLEKAKESTVRAGPASDELPLHFRVMLDRNRGATGHVRGHVGGTGALRERTYKHGAGMCGADGSESPSTQ